MLKSKGHEYFALDRDAYEEALRMESDDDKGDYKSIAEHIRSKMDPRKGLLLIYPIDHRNGSQTKNFAIGDGKCCKLSVFRRFLFCLFQTYSSSALLSRRRLYFCTYCHEFNSYNYPNILFHMLSTLRIICLIKREMLEKVRKFKDFY